MAVSVSLFHYLAIAEPDWTQIGMEFADYLRVLRLAERRFQLVANPHLGTGVSKVHTSNCNKPPHDCFPQKFTWLFSEEVSCGIFGGGWLYRS